MSEVSTQIIGIEEADTPLEFYDGISRALGAAATSNLLDRDPVDLNHVYDSLCEAPDWFGIAKRANKADAREFRAYGYVGRSLLDEMIALQRVYEKNQDAHFLPEESFNFTPTRIQSNEDNMLFIKRDRRLPNKLREFGAHDQAIRAANLQLLDFALSRDGLSESAVKRAFIRDSLAGRGIDPHGSYDANLIQLAGGELTGHELAFTSADLLGTESAATRILSMTAIRQATLLPELAQ